MRSFRICTARRWIGERRRVQDGGERALAHQGLHLPHLPPERRLEVGPRQLDPQLRQARAARLHRLAVGAFQRAPGHQEVVELGPLERRVHLAQGLPGELQAALQVALGELRPRQGLVQLAGQIVVRRPVDGLEEPPGGARVLRGAGGGGCPGGAPRGSQVEDAHRAPLRWIDDE